jgi:AAA domain (Cdc48 subfamily)/C-terminal, D2-small domain, of ClpB protein
MKLLTILCLLTGVLQAEIYHHIKKVDGKGIHIEKGITWSIDKAELEEVKQWKAGDRLKIYLDPDNRWKIVHAADDKTVFGTLAAINKKEVLEIKNFHLGVELSDGNLFSAQGLYFYGQGWEFGHPILWFHTEKEGSYTLLNLELWSTLKNVTINKQEDNTQKTSFDLTNVLDLENRLLAKIKGQPHAVKAVADAIVRYAAKINDPQKPIATFFFLGPTGVGKTELTKALSQTLSGTTDAIIRLNMADFSEEFTITRLIGSPPGYVGCWDGGQLTEAIKKNPTSIVLLDEIEKAHTKVHKIFLSAFDEGFIIDAKGERIDCSQVIFIMTSNLCADQIFKLADYGADAEEIVDVLRGVMINHLSPEFYNRLDPVVFYPLTREALDAMIDAQLGAVIGNLKKKRGIDLKVDESVIHYLRQNGYIRELGARPLKSLIQKKIVGTVAYAIIRQGIPEGSAITLYFDKDTGDWFVEA